MRRLTTFLLALLLAVLVACGDTTMDSAAVSSEINSTATVESAVASAPADPSHDTTAEQRSVLDGCVDFAADTAGGSLKSARAAAALVEYLSYADIDAATAADWMAALPQEQRDLLDTNWSGILENAQNIASDPSSQADLLASAGVTTNFGSMVLTEVPDKLVVLNAVFTGKAA